VSRVICSTSAKRLGSKLPRETRITAPGGIDGAGMLASSTRGWAAQCGGASELVV